MPVKKQDQIGEDLPENAPDRQPTEAEVETRSKERIVANGELIDKTLQALVEKNIVSQTEIDNFVLPNRQTPIHTLRKSIAELTDQINSTTLDDPEQKVADLESSRSVLVTELLYSVTGFAKKVVLNKINTLIIEVRSEKESKGTLNAEKVGQLKDIQSLTPQWEALETNSVDIMKYFREKHDADVTNTFLGMLNESLYLAVNKDTSDLDAAEKRGGGGTLADEMAEVTARLQRLFRINLDVLIQPGRTPVAAAAQPVVDGAPVLTRTAEAQPVAPVAQPPEARIVDTQQSVAPLEQPLQSEGVPATELPQPNSEPMASGQEADKVIEDIPIQDPAQVKVNQT